MPSTITKASNVKRWSKIHLYQNAFVDILAYLKKYQKMRQIMHQFMMSFC